MGQVYNAVIQKERRGDFLGGTIQAVPHLTGEIKQRVRAIGRITGAQAVIIEVGGTVGDIEGQVFLEAIRQMRREEAPEDTLNIHVTYLPYITATGEIKTKRRSTSVQELRRMGIQPDVDPLSQRLPGDRRNARQSGPLLRRRAPRCRRRADGAQHLRGSGAARRLRPGRLHHRAHGPAGRPARPRGLAPSRRTHHPPALDLACRGRRKYVELRDAYLSVKESLIHAGAFYDTG
jgi:CTP synthase